VCSPEDQGEGGCDEYPIDFGHRPKRNECE